jgi:hypothetical protein
MAEGCSHNRVARHRQSDPILQNIVANVVQIG